MISIDTSFRAAFLAAAVFGCASGTAVAADTQAAWEGFMQITGITGVPGACAGVGGAAVGDIHVSIYRPHILSTDTPTFLSVVFLRAAFTLENGSEITNPQMRGSGADTTRIIDGRGAAGAVKGLAYSNIIVAPIPPALSVSESTTNITVTGTIDSYFNAPGCNVTFKAEYVKE
jgi:hypothetical protein